MAAVEHGCKGTGTMVEILRLLRAEHANLGKVFDVLEREVDTYRERGRLNHEIVRDVIECCRGYPALCHHPKEDLIYRKLKLVAEPAAFERVCDLLAEHEALEALTDALEAGLDNLLSDAEGGPGKFVPLARDFLERQRRHMETEEGVLFPVALESLSEEDWAEIDRQVIARMDPQSGDLFDARFAALCGEIVEEERAYQESSERMDRVL
jgi:hemerythrin-like domain-containing protein